MSKVYVGDIGTVILIDMGENISTATGISLKVMGPKSSVKTNGTIKNGKTWTPSIYGTNYLKYTVLEGDLDLAGDYYINPVLTLGSWTGTCDTATLTVYNKGE